MFLRLCYCSVICLAIEKMPQSEVSTTNPPGRRATESIDVDYCRAQLQLAEADLKRVRSTNQRLPRTVPASVVAEFERDVDIARWRLGQAETGAAGDEFSVWLRSARADLARAESEWNSAVAVNQRSKGTIDAMDVERYRLRKEVYRLQYARGLALVEAPHDAQLGWRIELVTNELKRVKEDTTRRASGARYYNNNYNYFYYYPYW